MYLDNKPKNSLRMCFVIVTTDRPSVLECIRFQGRCRTINILRQNSTNYSQFGIFHLNDPNGDRVHSIEHKH